MSNIVIYDTYNVNVTIENDEVVGVQVVAGFIHDVIAGTNITIDKTDPLNPIISSSSSGSSYTFTNGLTESGGTVKLGGNLTENTTIDAANYSFGIEGQDGTEAGRFTLDYTNFSLEYENTGSALTGIIGGSTGLQLYTTDAFQVTADNGVSLMPPASGTGNLRFLELAANGSHYVGFRSPNSIASNVLWTLPSTDGTANYGLTTNGSGTLNWSNVLIGTGTNTLTGNTTITGSTSYSLTLTNLTAFDVYSPISAQIAAGSGSVLSLSQDLASISTGVGAKGIFFDHINGTTLTLGSDAANDMYYRNSSGYLTRLPAGTNGYVLTSNSGVPTWAAPSGGSGITIGSTSITGGISGRLLTSGSTVGEQTLGTGVSTWLSTPSWTNFNSAITGTAPFWSLASGGTLTGANTITGTTTNILKGVFNNLNVTQTNGAGLWLANTQAAGAGAQQISPSLVLEGQGWKTNSTAASQSVKFSMDVLPVQGAANPTGNFIIRSSINNAAYTAGNGLFLLSSGGDLSLLGGITISGSSSTGRAIFFNGGNGELRADANSTIALRINAATTVQSSGYFRVYNTNGNYTNTSGENVVQGLEMPFAPTSGTGTLTGLKISGTINQTGGANGATKGVEVRPTHTSTNSFIAFDYNPVSGTPTSELSYRATQGKFLSGGSSITANTFHDLRGGSTNDKILRLADGSNNELFTFKADKEYEVTQTNGKYQERQGTGTTSSTVYNEIIYTSTDISDGQSVTIEVLWTAKDSGANTGAGGIFYTTWTKAGGTLAKAGDNQLVTNDNMTGSWALSTSDSSGSIQLTFTGTGVANTKISFSTRIIKSN